MRLIGQIAVVSACAIGTLVSCAGNESPGPTSADPSVSISTSDPGAVVAREASRSTTIAVARAPGDQGAVILSADSVPVGVSVTFLPKRLEAGQTTSIATMMVDAQAEPRNVTLVFRATDADQRSATSLFLLQIPTPKITLTRQAGPITTVRGGVAVSASVLVMRENGANGSVTFQVDSVPAGVVVVFHQSTIGRGAINGVFSVTATSGAALGPTSFRIRASTPGASDFLLTLPLAVASTEASGFELAAAVTTLTVEAGKSATMPISVLRLGDFGGAVSLAHDSARGGLRAADALIATNASETALRISADLSVVGGEYLVRVRGRALGMADRTVSVRVVVVPAFSLFASNLDLPRGSVGSSSVSIARSADLAGLATLTSESLPKFITASFNPSATIGPFSSLILTASQDAPEGEVVIEVLARVTGASDQRIPVRVLIKP